MKHFFSLATIDEFATYLDTDLSLLQEIISKLDSNWSSVYKSIIIKKRNGGNRNIFAPEENLKNIQRKLSIIFTNNYFNPSFVHGFCKNKNIVTNANMHLKRSHVLNIDLKNFFPSIKKEKIFQLLTGERFQMVPDVAHIITSLCCLNGELPQGAPTSPSLSNFICENLDKDLDDMAKRNDAIYSRYCDDITFSFLEKNDQLPKEILELKKYRKKIIISLSKPLLDCIHKSGFEINDEKVRIGHRPNRQEVTGLTINEFVNVQRKYVRQVKSMIYAWERWGVEKAENEFIEKYYFCDSNYRPSYVNIVKGKLAFLHMVKGKNDPIYVNLAKRFNSLIPDDYKKLPIDELDIKNEKEEMKFASFDLEIAKELPEKFDRWEDFSPLGISCAAVALSDTQEIKFWSGSPQMTKEECVKLVGDLQRLVRNGYHLLTWNGTGFDFHVLAQESGLYEICGELALQHIDMMLLVTFQKGWYLSLEKALQGAGIPGKIKEVTLNDGTVLNSMSGAQAPRLWAAGEYRAVFEYLKGDVLQPLHLAYSIQSSKKITWISGRGNRNEVEVPKLYNVLECFSLPMPDVSWMSSPPSREQFVSWIPKLGNSDNFSPETEDSENKDLSINESFSSPIVDEGEPDVRYELYDEDCSRNEKEYIIDSDSDSDSDSEIIRLELGNGSFYFGEIQSSQKIYGKFRGHGVLIAEDKTKYIGIWEDGHLQSGVIVSPDGSVKFGTFEYDIIEDFGIQIENDGNAIYIGEHKGGTMDGKGLLLFENKDFYDGEFKDNELSGIGKITTHSGKIIKGEWSQNELIKNIGSDEDNEVDLTVSLNMNYTPILLRKIIIKYVEQFVNNGFAEFDQELMQLIMNGIPEHDDKNSLTDLFKYINRKILRYSEMEHHEVIFLFILNDRFKINAHFRRNFSPFMEGRWEEVI